MVHTRLATECDEFFIVEEFKVDQFARGEIDGASHRGKIGADAVDYFYTSAEDIDCCQLVPYLSCWMNGFKHKP